MPLLIGTILVVIALASVVTVMYFVVREEPQHEEYYIPQEAPSALTSSEASDPATR